eukprot:12402644-Heterocapsa_arctica.AAC.1
MTARPPLDKRILRSCRATSLAGASMLRDISLAALSAASLPSQCSRGTPLLSASAIVAMWAGTQVTLGTPTFTSLFQ